MKNKILITIILIFIITFLFSCKKGDLDESKPLNLITDFILCDTLDEVENKKCKVVLLYGQSNASGYTRSNYLNQNDPSLYDLYMDGFNNVYINCVVENYLNASSGFQICTSGYGANKYLFGPECGISEILSSEYGDEDVFIIKYSYGGTNLERQWLNGYFERGGLYNASIKFTRASLDYLKEKGYIIDILGICWMQGEADACSSYNNYYKNTKCLVNFFRDDLKEYDKSIKFIDAYISESGVWSEAKRVNSDKLRFSNKSNLNYVIDTLDLTTSLEPTDQPDIAHYDSMSMVALGRRFGEYLIK